MLCNSPSIHLYSYISWTSVVVMLVGSVSRKSTQNIINRLLAGELDCVLHTITSCLYPIIEFWFALQAGAGRRPIHFEGH